MFTLGKKEAPKKEWVPNPDSPTCNQCGAVFNIFNHKHLCRRCGGAYCRHCTTSKIVLRSQGGKEPVRVCDTCKQLERKERLSGTAAKQGKVSPPGKGTPPLSPRPTSPRIDLGLGSDALSGDSLDGTKITEEDLKDPAIVTALLELGWEGGSLPRTLKKNTPPQEEPLSAEKVTEQANELKRKAQLMKKHGRPEAARQTMGKARELEAKAEALQAKPRDLGAQKAEATGPKSKAKNTRLAVTDDDLADPEMANQLKELGWVEESKKASKAQEDTVLAHKQRALQLKREGDMAGAKEELKRAKLLEQWGGKLPPQGGPRGGADPDLDPETLRALKEVGWEEGDHKSEETGAPSKLRLALEKEILEFKKRALALKRQGRGTEAKEELKKSKLLEAKLEEVKEQEAMGLDPDFLLAEEEEEGNLDSPHLAPPRVDPRLLVLDVTDDGGAIDVTEEDEQDPEMLAELKEFGWEPETSRGPAGPAMPAAKPTLDRGALQRQALELKRQCLALKRQGKQAEALELLKQAKLIEKRLEEAQEPEPEAEEPQEDEVHVTEEDEEDPEIKAALSAMGWAEAPPPNQPPPKPSQQPVKPSQPPLKPSLESTKPSLAPSEVPLAPSPSSLKPSQAPAKPSLAPSQTPLKPTQSLPEPSQGPLKTPLMPPQAPPRAPLPAIDKDALEEAMYESKRKAVALRREGKLSEAQEELKRAKAMEKQLEELEAEAGEVPPVAAEGVWAVYPGDLVAGQAAEAVGAKGGADLAGAPALTGDDHLEITSEDEHDPEILSTLQGFGWKDPHPGAPLTPPAPVSAPPEDKLALQQEALRLKRQALALKREGKASEAMALLKQAKAIEQKLDTFLLGAPQQRVQTPPRGKETARSEEKTAIPQKVASSSQQDKVPSPSQRDKAAVQQEILEHKRKAVVLKREGKTAEALEELKAAKLLERQLEEIDKWLGTEGGDQASDRRRLSLGDGSSEDSERRLSTGSTGSSAGPCPKPENPKRTKPKVMDVSDRIKLQKKAMDHKRKYMSLHREGKEEEAIAELEQAKAIEKQLEEVTGGGVAPSPAQNLTPPKDDSDEDPEVEDVFDPALMAALRSAGLSVGEIRGGGPVKGPPKVSASKSPPQGKPQGAGSPGVAQGGAKEAKGKGAPAVSLEDRIMAEKRKAVEFKRAGKLAEAMEALKAAKLLERQIGK